MKKHDKQSMAVDQVWRAIVSLVMDSRNDWRKKVTEATGFPFSRLRALRRLTKAPMTMKELAEASGMDAPATTVALNYLESRGLVERYPHPENRRAKLVRLTKAGRGVVDTANKVTDQAPDALTMLSEEDLDTLQRILAKIV